jgi:hypothetical protein
VIWEGFVVLEGVACLGLQLHKVKECRMKIVTLDEEIIDNGFVCTPDIMRNTKILSSLLLSTARTIERLEDEEGGLGSDR